MFEVGDTIRRKGGHLLYTILRVEERPNYGFSSLVVESELGLQHIHHLKYYELVDPPQIIAGYMELFQ